MSASTEVCDVVSTSDTFAPAGMEDRIQSKSCVAKPVPVTRENKSFAWRAT